MANDLVPTGLGNASKVIKEFTRTLWGAAGGSDTKSVTQIAKGTGNTQVVIDTFVSTSSQVITAEKFRKVVDRVAEKAATLPPYPASVTDNTFVDLKKKIELNSIAPQDRANLAETIIDAWRQREAAKSILKEMASRDEFAYSELTNNMARYWRKHTSKIDIGGNFSLFLNELPDQLGNGTDFEFSGAVIGMAAHLFEGCRIGKKTSEEYGGVIP
jgi:hypothetical protein